MVENFWRDLARGQKAEALVKELLESKTDAYAFEFTNMLEQHNGDIKATEKETGKVYYLEVKDDGRIAETRNVLCEEQSYFYNTCELKIGNMYSDYEYYCVLSQPERKLYIIDFSLLKKNYRKGIFKIIKHSGQENECYLVQLADIDSWGALLYTLEY